MTLIFSATLIYFNNEMLFDVYSYIYDIAMKLQFVCATVQVCEFSSLKF